MTILPQLERDLFKAAAERLPAPVDSAPTLATRDDVRPAPLARRSRLRRGVRAATTSLPIAISILVVIVIAAVAITAFKPVHGSAPSARPHGAASPRVELIRTIAVLGRPQTRADPNPQLEFPNPFLGIHGVSARQRAQRIKVLARWGNPQPDRKLFRVVTVPSLQAQVLIAPTTYQPSATSRQRSEGININVHSPAIP
jgi:hypothetical protein